MVRSFFHFWAVRRYFFRVPLLIFIIKLTRSTFLIPVLCFYFIRLNVFSSGPFGFTALSFQTDCHPGVRFTRYDGWGQFLHAERSSFRVLLFIRFLLVPIALLFGRLLRSSLRLFGLLATDRTLFLSFVTGCVLWSCPCVLSWWWCRYLFAFVRVRVGRPVIYLCVCPFGRWPGYLGASASIWRFALGVVSDRRSKDS